MAARATKQLRARDRLALPLLYLLHLIFTLSSLILRLYQSIFGSQHEQRPTKPIKPPRHVALVLSASSYSSTTDGRKAQQLAWLHSIERVEKLAMEEGVSSLSVWDNHDRRTWKRYTDEAEVSVSSALYDCQQADIQSYRRARTNSIPHWSQSP